MRVTSHLAFRGEKAEIEISHLCVQPPGARRWLLPRSRWSISASGSRLQSTKLGPRHYDNSTAPVIQIPQWWVAPGDSRRWKSRSYLRLRFSSAPYFIRRLKDSVAPEYHDRKDAPGRWRRRSLHRVHCVSTWGRYDPACQLSTHCVPLPLLSLQGPPCISLSSKNTNLLFPRSQANLFAFVRLLVAPLAKTN